MIIIKLDGISVVLSEVEAYQQAGEGMTEFMLSSGSRVIVNEDYDDVDAAIHSMLESLGASVTDSSDLIQ